MSIPGDLKYTKDHEWLRLKDGAGIVGITRHAADQLGDIVFVDLPAAGKEVKQFEAVASIESVKAVSDIYAPLSGKVARVNAAVASKPELVNSHPYDDGWLIEISPSRPDEVSSLLSASDYESLIRGK